MTPKTRVYLIPCCAEEAVALFDLTVTHLPIQICFEESGCSSQIQADKNCIFRFYSLAAVAVMRMGLMHLAGATCYQ